MLLTPDLNHPSIVQLSPEYRSGIECFYHKSPQRSKLIVTASFGWSGSKVCTRALNALINAFGEDRRDVEAFAVLQYMKQNGLKPDIVTYTTLMKALIRVEKFDEVCYSQF
nr:pentatricopeptide repeat-containing protein At5g42310, mitochondrial-like [Tanacetum cinerariifolium]